MANIRARGQCLRRWTTRVRHFEQRTRLRVALAEDEKIISLGFGENDQAGLHITPCPANGHTAPLAGANLATNCFSIWHC